MKIPGSVALITGAASGFGKQFSLHILKNGGKVFAVDYNQKLGETFEKECKIEFGPGEMKFQTCDVSNKVQLRGAFDSAMDTFQKLNIVCNNAGIGGSSHSETLANFAQNDIRRVIDIDLSALIEGTYLGINKMSKKNGNAGGVVINVASAAGLRVFPVVPVYTAAKHGVVAFTHCFKYLDSSSSDGVRVNALCPFFCETPIITNLKWFHDMIKQKHQFIDINDVTKAFSQCIENDEMNGKALAILPHGKIVDAELPAPTSRI